MVRAYKYLFILSLIVTGLLLITTLFLNIKHRELNLIEIEQYKTFKLAEELRITSEELTRFCRNYVIAGDPKSEEKYWEILAIRNGEKTKTSDSKIGLIDSIRKLELSKEELNLFTLAEKYSNDLVETEMIAFNAIKGIFKDDSGNFTKKGEKNVPLAQNVLFNKVYESNKEKIMDAINQFNVKIENRNIAETNKINSQIAILMNVLIFLAVMLITLLIFFLTLIESKIKKQLEYEDELQKAKRVAEINDRFKSISATLFAF